MTNYIFNNSINEVFMKKGIQNRYAHYLDTAYESIPKEDINGRIWFLERILEPNIIGKQYSDDMELRKICELAKLELDFFDKKVEWFGPDNLNIKPEEAELTRKKLEENLEKTIQDFKEKFP